MGRKSVKENKNVYQKAREAAGLTRAAASEAMQFISDARIEKMENGSVQVLPEDVLAMAEAYKKPELTNYYCSHECPIGRKYVPEAESEDLSQIVLEVISSVNALAKEKDLLVDISVDGQISESELADFVRIRGELTRISRTVASLQLWVDSTIAAGKLDRKELEAVVKAQKAVREQNGNS
ncbi:MAG: helix-turn-helix domain-containing protein [Lachnospiraceae bacterium]